LAERLISVSIVGTGLIGASIGKALCSKKDAFFVKGFDASKENAETALREGAICRIANGVRDALNADAAIIAIPVQFIPKFIKENSALFKKGSVVMDTGSTKELVVNAMKTLPQGVEFVGGHPIAGKEKSGPESASETLFEGKKFVLTKENRLSEKGKNIVLQVINTLNAVPVFMESARHDEMLAYTSHFPYFVSAALFKLVSEKESSLPELFEFAGSGLRDTTRIASGDPVMSYGMLETNKDNIMKALSEFEKVLKEFRTLLESGTLPEKLKAVKERRDEVWK